MQPRDDGGLPVRHAQFQKFALGPQLRADFREQRGNAFARRRRNRDRVRVIFLQPVQRAVRPGSVAGSSRSSLLRTMMVGFPPAPISASTAFTA